MRETPGLADRLPQLPMWSHDQRKIGTTAAPMASDFTGQTPAGAGGPLEFRPPPGWENLLVGTRFSACAENRESWASAPTVTQYTFHLSTRHEVVGWRPISTPMHYVYSHGRGVQHRNPTPSGPAADWLHGRRGGLHKDERSDDQGRSQFQSQTYGHIPLHHLGKPGMVAASPGYPEALDHAVHKITTIRSMIWSPKKTA